MLHSEDPSRDDIEAAVARLAQWEPFARSPQLVEFLRYVVDAKLRGDEQQIKAYAIAVDVFGRKADFDPQKDSIVRVQAGRLRALLREYYAGPGRSEPIKFKLPVGRYVPQFVVTHPSTTSSDASVRTRAPRPPITRIIGLVAIVLALVIGTGSGFLVAMRLPATDGTLQTSEAQASADLLVAPDRPVVMVGRFADQTEIAEYLDIVRNFPSLVAGDTAKFGTVDIRLDLSGDIASLRNLETESVRAFLLTGTFGMRDGRFEMRVLVTDVSDGDVVFAQTLRANGHAASVSEAMSIFSQKVAARIGSLAGPLHGELSVDVPVIAASLKEPTLYACKVYLQRGLAPDAGAAREQARLCFARYIANGKNRALSEARAALSMLNSAEAPSRSLDERYASELYAELLGTTQRAAEELPDNAFIAFLLALTYEQGGFFPEARRAYVHALDINPASPTIRAAYGNLLALRIDAWEEGISEVAAARDLMGGGAPWFALVPALDSLMRGDFNRALSSARTLYQDDPALAALISLAAVRAMDNVLLYDRYYPLVMEMPLFRHTSIKTYLAQRVDNSLAVGLLTRLLQQAGIDEAHFSSPIPVASSRQNTE